MLFISECLCKKYRWFGVCGWFGRSNVIRRWGSEELGRGVVVMGFGVCYGWIDDDFKCNKMYSESYCVLMNVYKFLIRDSVVVLFMSDCWLCVLVY